MRRVPPIANPSTDPALPYRDASSGNYPGSWPGAEFFNALLAELCHLIEYAGLTLNQSDLQQVRKAVEALIAGAVGAGSSVPRDFRVVTAGPLTSPPGSPAEGDQYLIGGSASGDFAGKDYQIATRASGAWSYSGAVIVGRVFRIDGTDSYYERTVGGWAAYTPPVRAHTHPQSDVTNLVTDLAAINAAISGKVAKAGDTMTGALRFAQGLPYEITTDGTGFFFKDVTNMRYPVKFLAGSYDNALVIDASGNVGVNTTTPTEKLHVVGKAYATEGYRVNAAGQPSMIKPGQGDGASATLCNLVIDSWWGVGFANTLPAAGVPVGENGAWIDVRNGDVGYRSALMPNGDVGTTGKVLTGGRPNTWKLPSEIWGRKIVAVGRATGASAAITFASAEPDTSYEVAGYGGWGGSGDNSGGTSTNLSLSSKSTGGCTVNLNDEGGGAPTGSVRMFYIIFRNA